MQKRRFTSKIGKQKANDGPTEGEKSMAISSSLSFSLFSKFAYSIPNSLIYPIADLAGGLHYLLARNKRKSYRENTEGINNTSSNVKCLRAFQNHAANLLELIRSPHESEKTIRERITIYGGEKLDKALSLGKGVVITTGHFGNWEISGLALAIEGYPITTVAGEQLRGGWSEEVKKLKEHYGINLVSPQDGFMKLIRDLEANRAIVLHMDGNIFTSGVLMDFLKKRAFFPRGPARIARLMQSPSIFAYCLRKNAGEFHVYIGDPIPPPENDRQEVELLKFLVGKLEELVFQRPEQWCIFRDISVKP